MAVGDHRHHASVRQQHRVRDDIASHNPRAVRTTASDLAAEIASGETMPPPAVGAGAPIGHAHHHAAARIAMPVISREQLRRWLLALPRDILRAKGVAVLDDGAVCHFQRTDDADEPPALMAGALPDGLEPCAILIGPRVDAAAAESLLESVRNHPSAAPPQDPPG